MMKFMIRGISYKFKFYKKLKFIYLNLRLGYNYKVFFKINSAFLKFKFTKIYDYSISSYVKELSANYSKLLQIIHEVDIYKSKGIKYYYAPLILKIGKIRK